MRVVGVFNRDGGTFKTTDMEAFSARAVEAFARHGHELDARVVEGKDLLAGLEAAVDGADLLLAGGGDGTVSAAAGIAFRRGVPLAVLPAGTMNLFARSLGMPLNLDAALDAIADGELKDVDIATANGRPFIHQFSVGIHPKLVKLRESLTYSGRIGKMMASTRAALGAIIRPPIFRAEIVTRRGMESRSIAGISISNNPFGDGPIPHAERLDAGTLGIYVVAPLNPLVLARLFLGVVSGHWKSAPEVMEREAREVIVRFPRKKHDASAVIDGELIDLADQVQLKIHPGALKVMMPKSPARAAPTIRDLLAPA